MQKSIRLFFSNIIFFTLIFLFNALSIIPLKADTVLIDLSSNLTINPTTIEVSQPFQSDITIKNENSGSTIVDGNGASISYHIPAGSTYNGNYTGSGWDCDTSVDSNGDIGCTYNESLTNGETSNLLSITLTAPSATGSDTPSVTVTATSTDANTSNDTSSTTVEFGKSNLQVSKTTSKTTLQLGEEFSYTITLSNPYNGTNPTVKARNVVLTDTLPSEISFVSLSDTSWCSESDGTITCSGSDLDVGSEMSVTITVKASSGGTDIKNTASADADSSNYIALPTTSSASVDVELADLVLTQSLVGGLDANDAIVSSSVTYRLHVVNNGASPAENVTLSDTLPDGVTFESFADSADWDCTDNSPNIDCTLKDTNLTEGEAYDLDINVKMPSTHGDITNNATVSTPTSESDTANNSSSLLTHVLGADLNIEKTPDGGSTDIGTDYTYTIKVTNAGSADADNVVVTDTLDPSMTYKSDSQSCTRNGQTLTCNLGTISANSDKSFTVTVTMPTDSLDDVTNSVSVTTDTDQENTGNLTDTATTHITGPDLVITKDANVTDVGLGKTFSYSINVKNINTADATDANITDQLPSGVSITDISSAGWSCPSTPITGTFVCSKATVSGGESDTLVFTATAPSDTAGTITNSATVSQSLNSNDGSSSVDVNVKGVALSISKVASATAVTGGLIDYNITVSNTSLSDAEDLTLSDDLSNLGSGYTVNSVIDADGWSCSGSTTLSCTRDSLTSHSSSTIHFTVNVPVDAVLGTRTNTATVTTTTTPQPTESDSASTVIKGADIVVVPPTTTTAVANENVVFTVEVRNDGSATAKDVNITNYFNTNNIADFTNIGIDCDGGTNYTTGSPYKCELGDIAPNESKTITISATAPNYDSNFPGNSDIINRSSAVTTTSQNDTTNDSVDWSVEIHGSDIVVYKSSDKTEVPVDGIVTYTINVKNQWEATATNIQLDDNTLGTSPDLFTFIDGTLNYDSNDWDCTLNSSTNFSCTYKHDLAQNETTSDITIQAKAPNVDSAVNNQRDNQVDVTTDTAERETATTNTKIVPVTIRGADLSISKTVSPTTVKLQDSVTYTITVSNGDLADANNTYVDDTLPDGFTNISTSGCDNDGSSVSGQSVHCTLGTIANGDSKTFTITANAPNENGTYTNTATTSSDTPEANTANNTDSADLIVQGADIVPYKAAPARVAGNSTFAYTISLRNQGASTAYGAKFTDTIPTNDGTTYVSGSLTTLDGDWTCSLDGSTITCQTNDSNLSIPSGYDHNIVTFKVKAGPAHYWIYNTVTAETNTSESNTANNTYTAATEVIDIDLQARKLINDVNYGNAENYIGINGTLVYKIQVRNGSLVDLNITDVNVTDLIPSNVSSLDSVSADSRFTCNSPSNPGDTLTCTMNDADTNPLTISEGWIDVATITVKAIDADHFDINDENNNFIINKYKAETTLSDQDLGNNAPTTSDGYLYTNTLVRGSNMSIVKTASSSIVGANKDFSYTLSVKNWPRSSTLAHDIPSTTATNIVVTDVLPSDVNFTSATGTNWSCSESSHIITCNYSGDMSPSNTASNISINVTAPNSDNEVLTNEANVTNDTPELSRLLVDNNDTVSVTTQGTDITISKTGPAAAGMGDVITYSVTVANSSPTTDAKNIYIIDTLPDGATYDGNISNSHWTSSVDANGSIKFTYDQDLLLSTSTSFTYSVTLPNHTGTVRNHVEAFTDTVETSTPNVADWDTDIQGANIVFASDIAQSPNPVGALTHHEYYVSIKNNGLSDARDINLTFEFNNAGAEPGWDGVAGSGTDWSCDTYDENNSKLVCHLSTLAGSTTAPTLTISSTAPNLNADVSNSATVIGIDDTNTTTGETKSVTTTVKGSDVKVKKYANDPNPDNPNNTIYYDDNITVGSGGEVNFKLSTSNINLGLSKDVFITDTLPAGFNDINITSEGDWNCSVVSNQITCQRDKIEPNSSVSDILYSAIAPSSEGVSTNTADINTSTMEVDTTNNHDSVDIKTEPATLSADMNTSKTEVKLGETFTYTLNIVNTGKNDAFDVNVSDILPEGLTYLDNNGSDADWNCTSSDLSSIICFYPKIKAYDGNTTLKIDVKAPTDQIGVFTNEATIRSISMSQEVNATAPDVRVVGSDLLVDIEATPVESLEDRNVTYTINVKNINISTAYDIRLGQSFSPSISALYIIDDGGLDCNVTDSKQGIECSLSSLDYDKDKNITVVATMPQTDTIIDPLVSTATVSTSTVQEDTDNDAASVNVKVLPIKPIADYRFDECSWDGDDGEVKDSISQLNGKAKYGAQTENRILTFDDNNFSTIWRVGAFDGVDDYVSIPNDPKLQIVKNQTICMWIKPKNFDSRENPYEKAYGGEGSITQERSGELTYYYGITGRDRYPYQGFSSNRALKLNKWNHICVVRNFDKMKLYWYMDGTLTNTEDTYWDYAVASSYNVHIGRGYAGAFEGNIDEVELYNIALDDRAVKDIYTNEKNLKNYDGTSRPEVLCGVDLKVVKTASPTPEVGAESSLNYTITVTNISSEPLTTGFTLRDVLPNGLTIVDTNNSSADVTCTGDYNFDCTLLPSNIMYKNDSRTITLSTISPNSSGEVLTNSVDVVTGVAGNPGQDDTDISNNSDSATVTTIGTDLSVSKTAVLDDNGSNLIHYTITVQNLSSKTIARDVSIIDTYDDRLAVTNYPSGISCSIPASAHYFSCTLPDIPPNSTFSFTTTMQADNGAGIINDVNVSSRTVDTNLSNNHAEVSMDVNVTGAAGPVKLKDGFRKHISINNYGNMIAIGNSVLKAENQDGNTSLSDVNTSYVNIDSQPLDSSSATLSIPENNITIEYAGLYWGGHIKGNDENDTLTGTFNTVKLKTPSGQIYSISGGDQENGNILTDDNTTGFYRFKRYDTSIGRLYYSCEANVTSILRDEYANNGTINGVFTVSDLNVSHGLDNTASFIPDDTSTSHWSFFNSGFFGGWELIVVYKVDHRLYRSVRYKNSTIFDGFKYLMPRSPGQAVSLDINVSGFITPYSGDIESTLYSMVLAGDMTLPYESMSVDDSSGVSHLVKEDDNNTDNIFNDTISLKNTDGTPIGKNLNLSYNPGVDLDQFDLTSNYDEDGNCISSPCYLNNAQTSTRINLQVRESSTETYPGSNQYAAQYAFANMLGFNTQIFTPDFIDSYKECFKKKEPASLVNNDWVPCSEPTPTIHRGSIIKYRITIINSGTDDAINVHVSDPLPKEVDFNGTCSSPNDDITATNIYALPDGVVTSTDDLDYEYDNTLRTISGQCDSALYDYNQTVRDECVEDIKAILIDGNTTTPLNTIPDGEGESRDFINYSYNGTSCSTDDNNVTTLVFSYPTFPKRSVTWIEFYTKVNSKAELGKSFQNSVAIDFTNQTLFSAGINNLQTQESEPVDSGTVTFNWSNIVTVARDPGRLTVGTKIVNRPFDLNISLTGISSLDIDSDGNTTMKISNVKLVDKYNNILTDISSSLVSDTATVNAASLDWSTHNTVYNRASKEIGFQFDLTVTSGAYTETKHYPSDFDATAPYAGDVFTERPKDYTLSLPGSTTVGSYTVIKAGEASTLSVNAVDENGNNSLSYNNILSKANGINIILDPNFSTNPACINIGDLNITDLSFVDGVASSVNTKYNNVGVIKFDLTDTNWTAKDQGSGDCIANSGTNTLTNGIIGCNVEGNSTSVVFKPDRLDFNNTAVNDFGNNFTYMITNATTDQVYGKIVTNVVSKNVAGETTTFFSNSCFGDNVDVSLYYNIDSKSVNDLKVSIVNENNLTNISSDDNITALNNSYSTVDDNSSFVAGVGPMTLRVYVDRNKTTPLQPALMDIQDLNASLSNYLGISGVNVGTNQNNVAATNDMHFIYGRVHAPNYSSDNNTISAKIYYEGYCKDCNKTKFPSLGGESVDSIYWYINGQNSINDGNITNFAQPANTKITITPANSTSVANGVETHTITYIGVSYPYRERVDMNASSWLIFNPFDANATTSSFFVDFSKYNDWAGVGTTGKTVDLNISTKGSKRIEW